MVGMCYIEWNVVHYSTRKKNYFTSYLLSVMTYIIILFSGITHLTHTPYRQKKNSEQFVKVLNCSPIHQSPFNSMELCVFNMRLS